MPASASGNRTDNWSGNKPRYLQRRAENHAEASSDRSFKAGFNSRMSRCGCEWLNLANVLVDTFVIRVRGGRQATFQVNKPPYSDSMASESAYEDSKGPTTPRLVRIHLRAVQMKAPTDSLGEACFDDFEARLAWAFIAALDS